MKVILILQAGKNFWLFVKISQGIKIARTSYGNTEFVGIFYMVCVNTNRYTLFADMEDKKFTHTRKMG